MDGRRKVVVATLVTPTKTEAKRRRLVDPTDFLDGWMEKEVPVCGPPVPLCCAIRTCKKHKQAHVSHKVESDDTTPHK